MSPMLSYRGACGVRQSWLPALQEQVPWSDLVRQGRQVRLMCRSEPIGACNWTLVHQIWVGVEA